MHRDYFFVALYDLRLFSLTDFAEGIVFVAVFEAEAFLEAILADLREGGVFAEDTELRDGVVIFAEEVVFVAVFEIEAFLEAILADLREGGVFAEDIVFVADFETEAVFEAILGDLRVGLRNDA